MSIELKPHNEEVYEKVKEKLTTSNKTAVIHPTGTGKMYIALKLLEENKDRKAIYVAPSTSILHDVKKSIFAEGMNMSDFPNLKRITYQKLMKLSDEEIEELDCDIIVLDEFHHCGAPEWGQGVDRLIQRNPNANILGLSATPLRYFDGLRDMSDELFDNNVASEMTLEEAIEQGILPEATYVSTLYGYDAELEKMQANIDRIKDAVKKEQAQALLDSLSKKLDENTRNLPELLAEYMENQNGKYIIFCKNIQDMQEKMEQASKMFGSVNSNIAVRGVSSKVRDNENVLKAFENDNDENSLKLLYAVDMLNEGYHIRDLDGVVMMRPTFSPTIFIQQLGRVLTVGGENRPVVLDLVNNFDTCKIIEDFAERMRQYRGREGTRLPREATKSRISIFDKTKEFRDIASKITELSKRDKISLAEKIEIFEKFSETGEELTGNTIFERYPVGQWAIQIRSSINRMNEGKNKRVGISPTEEQLKRLYTLGILERQIDSTIDEKIEMLVQWMEKYPKAEIMQNIPEKILREYCATQEEYTAIAEEYLKMQRYYEYVRTRKSNDKLSKEQISKCKEGNVRGVFGYPTQVEELAEKSGQSEKTIDYIINQYGSIDNFKSLYRKSFDEETKLDVEDLLLAKAMFRGVIDIDLNPNSENYEKLYLAISGGRPYDKAIGLFSSEKLKSVLETLNPREKYIIERRYGLLPNDLPRDFESISNNIGVTRGWVRQIEARLLRKLRNPSRYKKFTYGFDKSEMLTDDEGRLIDELEDNLFASDIIFSNNLYESLQDDDKSTDILKAFELIKNMDEITETREKEKREQEAIKQKERYDTPLENTDISIRAYHYLKSVGIEKIIDLRHMTGQDEYNLIKILGKKGFIELLDELSQYYDDIVEDYQDRITEMTEDDIENLIRVNEEKDILETEIEELNLSVRAYNCLKRAGFNTLKDISQLSREELSKIRNLGRRGTEDVIQKLSEYGVTLREEISNSRENDEQVSKSKDIQKENESNKRKASIEPTFIKGFELITEEELTLNVAIEEVDLSVRTFNCLKRAGFNTLKDISQLSREELSKIRNLGKSGTEEVIEKLEQYGITLREDENVEKSEEKDETVSDQGAAQDKNESNDRMSESELEVAKAKKDELQEDVRKLQEQTRQAEKLIAEYAKLIGDDKIKTDDELPDFNDE